MICELLSTEFLQDYGIGLNEQTGQHIVSDECRPWPSILSTAERRSLLDKGHLLSPPRRMIGRHLHPLAFRASTTQ